MSPTLYWSPNSPYVRKVMVAAREQDTDGVFTIKRGVTSSILQKTEHDVYNPSGKVPTLVLEGGRCFFGSQTIIQYLDSLAVPERKVLPSNDTRYDELTLESLADTILDACLLVRYEISTRPEQYRWSAWIEGQTSKILRGLPLLYDRVNGKPGVYQLPDPTDPVLSLGGIAVACACWYLDRRFPEIAWREGDGQKLAEWYAVVEKRASWKGGEN